MSDQWPYAFLVIPFFAWALYLFGIRRLTNHYAPSGTSRATRARPVTEKRQVWHSSHSFASSLRHVALFVDRSKYEIRRDEQSQDIEFFQTTYPGDVPFPLYLGSMQARLQLNMIGHTTLNDSQITQLCDRLAKDFIYQLLSNNCQDFAFLIACGLVREEDRSDVWDVLFGPKDYQLGVLAKIGGEGLAITLPVADGQNFHQPDSTVQGGGGDFILGGIELPASVHLAGGGAGHFGHHAAGHFGHHAAGHH